MPRSIRAVLVLSVVLAAGLVVPAKVVSQEATPATPSPRAPSISAISEPSTPIPTPEAVPTPSQAPAAPTVLRNPDALYSTVAQISATIVAIFGGFLLTYGLTFDARLRSNRRKLAAVLQERDALKSHDETEKKAILAALDDIDNRKRSAFQDLLALKITDEERLATLQSISEEIRTLYGRRDAWQQRIEAGLASLDRGVKELEAEVAEAEEQRSRINWGMVILGVIIIVGIIVPVELLPAKPTTDVGLVPIILQLVFVLFLSALVLMMGWMIRGVPKRPQWAADPLARMGSPIGRIRRSASRAAGGDAPSITPPSPDSPAATTTPEADPPTAPEPPDR